MRIPMIAVAALLFAAGAAQAAPSECEANYQQEGSMLTGRTFRDWGTHPDKSVDVAYNKLYTGFAKGGFRIVNADRQLHIITAEQPTTLDSGMPSALVYNTVVEPEGKGSKVTVTMRAPPGKPLSADAVKKSLCSVVTITSSRSD